MTWLLKHEWPAGPWHSEPDNAQFVAYGLPCYAHRTAFGIWCGYVGLSPGHALYARDEREVRQHTRVHGGITYADYAHDNMSPLVNADAPSLWWVGFDCMHAGDLMPALSNVFDAELKYRTLDFVKAEILRLAAQLEHVRSACSDG